MEKDGHTTSSLTERSRVKETWLPRAKRYVEFLPMHPEEDDEGDVWRTVYIHSRAGKATGSYRNCLNIQQD